MRTPLISEAELQARELLFSLRQHSYELTQKLTYFVISIELVFCGYMLLNADKLSSMQGASYLFGTCGIAAFFGILWRFFYNQTYHNDAHGIKGFLHNLSSYSQTVCYWIYVGLSMIAFVWAMVAGFNYLNVAAKASMPDSAAQLKSSVQPPAPLPTPSKPSAATTAPLTPQPPTPPPP